MRPTTQQIIQRIGETDQLYLQGNHPELAIERAELRLELVTLSHLRQEQIHFLQEAIVILEQARIEFDEISKTLFIDLSLHLAKTYMVYFEITREKRFAIITEQILKPWVSDEFGDIYFFLAYSTISKEEKALTRHWLTKYSKTQAFDVLLLSEHHAFQSLHQQDWFQELRVKKMQ